VYALGSDEAERERLGRQSVELRDRSARLLDRVALGPGQTAIDLGCGPRGVIDLLSERVGPRGQVVGLDLDPTNVALARSYVNDRGLANVTVVEGDARRSGLADATFDVVHARTVLVNVPDPAAVLTEMVRLTRPGGWVAVMEPDLGLTLFHPPHPVWDRVLETFVKVIQAEGADPFVGRRLPHLLRDAGLTQVEVESRADVAPSGDSRRTVLVDLLRVVRAKAVASGIASDAELDDLDRAARRHLADPDTLAVPHLLFLAWGRKPMAGG